MQLPDVVVELLADKLFALVGFDSAESMRLISALQRVQASGRILGHVSTPSELCLKLEAFDVCLFNIGSGSAVDGPIPLFAMVDSSKPMLLVGTWRELTTSTLGAIASKRDFLLQPWEPEDLFLRSFRLLQKDQNARKEQAIKAEREPVVLIVDDDRTTTTMVAAILRKCGMQCSIARDGEEGVRMTQTLSPNVLVLDVDMPKLNGFEVLASLRDHSASEAAQVIMLTSHHQETDVIRGFALGASDYISKPFNPEELVARVRRLLV
jgi:CheY-like chemotaxis protein